MDREKRIRLNRIIKLYMGIAIVLSAYAAFACFAGFGIPCVFHLVTELRCPGCGISRFCLELIKFNFGKALSYNYAGPAIIVYFVWVAADTAIRYVKTGTMSLDPKPVWINYLFLALLVIWGIIRNITGI